MKKAQFGTGLDGLADLRLEDHAVDIGADIGAEAFAVSGVERYRGGQFIHDAELRADAVILALAVDVGDVILGPQGEIVVPGAEPDLKTIGQFDLVLNEHTARGLAIQAIVIGARDGRIEAAVYRIENIDDIGSLLAWIGRKSRGAGAPELLVVVEAVVIGA